MDNNFSKNFLSRGTPATTTSNMVNNVDGGRRSLDEVRMSQVEARTGSHGNNFKVNLSGRDIKNRDLQAANTRERMQALNHLNGGFNGFKKH